MTYIPSPLEVQPNTRTTFSGRGVKDRPEGIDYGGIAKVVLNGDCQGQDHRNILWYRLPAFSWVPNTIGQSVADAVYNQIWTPTWKSAMTTGYTLQTIDVYPFDQDFIPMTSLPFSREVNEPGTATGETPGPMACLTAKFGLEPISFGNGFIPPKRGYLSIGPYREGDVDNAGRLSTNAIAFWNQKINVFANNLSLGFLAPDIWPCRVALRSFPVVGQVLTGFADVDSIVLTPVASFRRSRMPEA